MDEDCADFNASVFRPNICRDCFRDKQDHHTKKTSIEQISNPDQTNSTVAQSDSSDEQGIIPSNESASSNPGQTNSTIAQRDNNDEQGIIPLTESASVNLLPSCRFGLSCYRTNPDHFRRYSHPPGHKRRATSVEISDDVAPIVNDNNIVPKTLAPTASEKSERQLKKELKKQKQSELRFIELIQNKIESLIDQLELKDDEVIKLRQDLSKLVAYNQQLEEALSKEINHREKREQERKNILAVSRQTPSYWGPNALEEAYREIELSISSPEFEIVSELLNSTISHHDNKYGTINGLDPTQFLINKIIRIHNRELWHMFCYKKDMIIKQNNDQLVDCSASKYLQERPLLTPLLDTKTNEYWLFHGCSRTGLNFLMHTGYDPRVSNLKGMFGGGFYLAENSSKSNQYIPCPKCDKNYIGGDIGCNCPNQEALEFAMVLYRAALGDIHVASKYDRTKYSIGPNKQRVRRPPKKPDSEGLYDSVMGESIHNGGDRLKYREFILYEPGQAYPEYIIYFRRSTANPAETSNIEKVKQKCQNFLINTFRIKPE